MKYLLISLLITLTIAKHCGKGGMSYGSNECYYPDYIEGCLQYSQNNECQLCEYNYQLYNGKCYYSPKANKDNCCLSFDNNSKCTRCAPGLQVNPQSQLCEDYKIVGCLRKAQQGCSVCSKDYQLIEGKCIPTINKCIKYDLNTNCVACDQSAVLQFGVCVPLIKINPIPNCEVQNDFGCGKCERGFRSDGQGQCKPAIPGCLIHTGEGRCKLCYGPHYQLNKGYCAVVGCTHYEGKRCVSCDTSVGFKLVRNRCVIEGCTYFGTHGCIVCSNGLVASSKGCRQPQGKVCLVCKVDEFQGQDGKCHKKDIHCIDYKNYKCMRCVQSHFLNPYGQCKPIQPGCIYQNGQCSSCSSPFVYYNGQCVINGCLQYSREGCIACDQRLILNGRICGLPHCDQIIDYKCVVCTNGYELNCNGQCVPVDPHCLRRNSMNMCLKCKNGYQLNHQGRCSAQKYGCNYVDGRCVSCRAPFVYVLQTESCEIDGCEDYFVGGCSKCAQSYSLLYNTCKLPNCLISREGRCIECDPDFVFRSDGTCVSKDEYCNKYDDNGICIECMDTYFYSSKKEKCVKNAPGCHYNSNDQCYKCDAPFTHRYGRCVIKGCIEYNDKGCYQCKYPFSLTKNRLCTIAHCLSFDEEGKCSSCSQGYALNYKKLCEIQDIHCKDYNKERTHCVQCVNGYFVNTNGKCQYGDQHCSKFDQYGVCLNCNRLYYLNPYGKCQIRDPQCLVYTNGYCAVCRPYYFPKSGICMANMAGCKQQKKYSQCQVCEDNYQLKRGNCVAKMNKLTWNSMDMNFWDDQDTTQKEQSQTIFTSGINTKLNLKAAFSSTIGQLFYSSWGLNDASILLDAAGSNGWSPKTTDCRGQFIGLKTSSLRTFYAIDIKQLTGSSLSSFHVQYSMNGRSFTKIEDFSFKTINIGSITTFYFKAVQARYIRLVVHSGTPNIRLQFYFSSGQSQVETVQDQGFIGKTIAATIDGAEQGGLSQCSDNGLCWAGVESCEPRKIQGFSLDYTDLEGGKVEQVKIEYSTDGLSFSCYNDCKPIRLVSDGYKFQNPLWAQKMHVHFTKYSGQPKFGIHFDFA